MSAEPPLSSLAQASCERCGSVLVIFEAYPDGDVIYCACPCRDAGADRVSASPLCSRCAKPLEVFQAWDDGEAIYVACGCSPAPAAPPAVRDARRVKGHQRCRSCGAVLIVVGARPDGSPIEAECACQQPLRPDQARRAMVRVKPPDRSLRPAPAPRVSEPVERESGIRSSVMFGAASLVFVAALAGLWAQRHGGLSIPEPAHVATPPPPNELAPEAPAPPTLQPGGVEVQNDGEGLVTLVSGADPSAVLRAFCRHPQFKSALVPGSLQSTIPPDPDLLVGTAVLLDGAGTPRQVILKRNPATKRWSIGDGVAAIVLVAPVAAATSVPAGT